MDIESRSDVDLRKRGAYLYATDPSTEIICICWAVGNGEIQAWQPGDPYPQDLADRIREGGAVWAHNAQFERLMFDYVVEPDHEIPAPELGQWRCSAVLCRLHSLPGKLGEAGRALRLGVQKDRRGEELIRLLCIPPHPGWDDPGLDALLGEMVDYCRRDVEVEREIQRVLGDLDEYLWEQYHLSERINDRGLLVDLEIARAALPYAATERAALAAELAQLTGIEKLGSPKVLKWLQAHLPPAAAETLVDDSKKSGLSIDKYHQEVLLDRDDVEGACRRVVELKQAGGKASVSKYEAMLDRADPDDGRIRGAYLFGGALQTGRYSSIGLQVHNLPRECAKDREAEKQALLAGRMPDVMQGLKRLLRPTVIAGPGRTFVCGDWAGIEARALPWLTMDPRAEEVLDVFRGGEDIYLRAAAQIPGADRQVGKVAVLSLGYGGGWKAFQAMGRGYGVRLDESRVRRVVWAWRDANPWAVDFWAALQDAVADAWREDYRWCQVGRVAYQRRGDHLYCRLPSGRELMYPWFERDVVDGRFGPEPRYSCIKGRLVPAWGNPWPRMKLWGGLQAENVTQAACADLLMDTLWVLGDEPIVGHTHDEVLLEVPREAAENYRRLLASAMEENPRWAAGLPLAVETWIGDAYRK